MDAQTADSIHAFSHTDIHNQTSRNREEYISSNTGKVEDKLSKSSRQTWLPWSVVLTELGGSEVDYCWCWTNTVYDCCAVLRCSMHFTLLSKWCDKEWKAFLCTQAEMSEEECSMLLNSAGDTMIKEKTYYNSPYELGIKYIPNWLHFGKRNFFTENSLLQRCVKLTLSCNCWVIGHTVLNWQGWNGIKSNLTTNFYFTQAPAHCLS